MAYDNAAYPNIGTSVFVCWTTDTLWCRLVWTASSKVDLCFVIRFQGVGDILAEGGSTADK
eukprot:1744224-Amphidinium_carterae.1